MKAWIGGLLLVWVTGVGAATLDANLQSNGMLVTGQTTAGAPGNTIQFGRSKLRAVVFAIWTTSGSGTALVEIRCASTVPWGVVANSQVTLSTTASSPVDIVYPGCEYRVNVTACTGCNVSVYFASMPEQ